MSRGVRVFLFLIDPESLTVTWASEQAEALTLERTGASAVGQPVEDVVYMARPIGLIEKLERVAMSGEAEHLWGATSGPGGGAENRASVYRLPSGDVLLAGEWSPGPR